jgi:uncharacterized C2H2 Zn-finger protein
MPAKSSRNQEKHKLFAERHGELFLFNGIIDTSSEEEFYKRTGKFFYLGRVYSKTEMQATLADLPKINPHELKDGDCVYMFVTRQDYGRVKNNNHGWVIVRANIRFDGWKKELAVWKDDIERWKKPIGRETTEQYVNHCYYKPRCKYILAKIGTVQYYPEKGGKRMQKQKRVEIRECWRCGGKAKVSRVIISQKVSVGGYGLAIRCSTPDCGARGLEKSTRDAAIAWWNKRHSDADEEMVGGND